MWKVEIEEEQQVVTMTMLAKGGIRPGKGGVGTEA